MEVSNRSSLAIEGGLPVRDNRVRPWPEWPIYGEAEERALREVLHSGHWWSAEGTQVAAFEAEFAAFHNARFAVACTNGTAALEIALRAVGIGRGDEVILPAYTFVATATAVLSVGAIPVIVDIQGDTLNIDPQAVAAAITPRTRAIVPVHIAGRPADMDALLALAHKHGLRVIEDAAQAHAASWRGTGVGALGDIGTFSLQASKNLNAGEGGLILSNTAQFADAAWSAANVGNVRDGRWPSHDVLPGNYRMTEFQAALARVQLMRLDSQTARRTKSALLLRELLGEIAGIHLPFLDPRITCHAYHLFTFRYDATAFGGHALSRFVEALNAEGIPCSTGYVPLYRSRLFAQGEAGRGISVPRVAGCDAREPNLPVCEGVCQDTVWLKQSLLLGSNADMADIATAIARIQGAWNG